MNRQTTTATARAVPAIAAAVCLREARFEDHARIAELEGSEHLKARSYADWSRLWLHNPVYRDLHGAWPIGWVLETNEGEVVGSIGNVPLHYIFRGRKLLVAAGRGWVVHPKYRSFALLLMDALFGQSGVDLLLNTTVSALAAEGFGVFGSPRVPVGDWQTAAYWITGHRGFAESVLRLKGAPMPALAGYPAGTVLYLKDVVAGKRLPGASSGTRVELAPGFDDRFDAFWEKLKSTNTVLLGVRTRAVLDWHFGGAPAQAKLRILTISRENGLVAYAVFQRRDDTKSGMKRLRLADFQALEHEREYGTAITRAALDLCRREGIHALENIGCDVPNTGFIDEFAPYRRKLSTWAYFYHTYDPVLAAALREPSAWAPSSFDGDATL